MATTPASAARRNENSVEIDAPIEEVWQALTTSEGLCRWFPLQAKVTPGVGGAVWFSWGAGFEGDARIEIWEEPTRFSSSWEARPAKGYDPSVRIMDEWTLEGRGGTTTVRLVSSGFGKDSSWDSMYDSIRRGWKFELRGLKHYLERHAGEDRRVAWAQGATALSEPQAWSVLTGAKGIEFSLSLEKLKAGERYTAHTPWGETLSGVAHRIENPGQFVGSVDGRNDGLLRIEFCPGGPGNTGIWVWLSTYGVAEKQVKEFEASATTMLEDLFPAKSGA